MTLLVHCLAPLVDVFSWAWGIGDEHSHRDMKYRPSPRARVPDTHLAMVIHWSAIEEAPPIRDPTTTINMELSAPVEYWYIPMTESTDIIKVASWKSRCTSGTIDDMEHRSSVPQY